MMSTTSPSSFECKINTRSPTWNFIQIINLQNYRTLRCELAIACLYCVNGYFLLCLCQSAVAVAIGKINNQPDHQPDQKPVPVCVAFLCHQVKATDEA